PVSPLSLHDALPICARRRDSSLFPHDQRWRLTAGLAFVTVPGLGQLPGGASMRRSCPGSNSESISTSRGTSGSRASSLVRRATRSEEHTSELQSPDQ